ncbi:MAG TPA: hypothetical protein VK399_17795 [Longimicrobiaceae bacterium]|jgi:hypothetical protein|nr:hypothetical protein [Longimicrobiaceae bacterium]
MKTGYEPLHGNTAVEPPLQVGEIVDPRQFVANAEVDPRFDVVIAELLKPRLRHYLERVYPWSVAGTLLVLVGHGSGMMRLPVSVLHTLVVAVLAPTPLLLGLAALVLAWKWGKAPRE